MQDMRDSGIDWLGNVPSSWKLRKIKFCFDIVKDVVGYEGPPVLACTNTGIKVKDLTYGSGQIAKDYSNYQWVRPGDFVMNNLDLVGGWIDVSTLEGVTSPDYRVFRSRGPEYDNGYYRHLFQLCYMDRIFRDTSNVVEGMGWGRMQAPVFKNFIVPVPNCDCQHMIAAYLDSMCGEVDRAIYAAEQSISEYESYRTTSIYRCVTKGLSTARPYCHSGIDWLGEIPADWKLSRTKYFFERHKDIAGNLSEQYDRLALTMSGVVKRSKYANDGLQPADFGSYQILQPNDLVFKLIDLQNVRTSRVGLSPYEGLVSPAYIAISPKGRVNARFAEYYFKYLWYGRVFNNIANEGVRTNLGVNDVLNLPLLIPSIREQQEIADHLDSMCAEINAAIAAKRNIIDELKAYKRSLVYEYVTGKREVPCQ